MNKALLGTFCFLMLSSAGMSANAAMIVVDTVDARPGDHFGLKVRLSDNTQPLAGMTLPLHFDNPFLTLDSVSFVNSILSGSIGGITLIDNIEQTVLISYIPDVSTFPIQTISVSAGQVAELWFSLSSSALPVTVSIDSLNELTDLGSGISLWTRVELTDASGTSFVLPGFDPGAIVVQVSTAVNDDSDGLLPTEFNLDQNYPNPFNPSTVIEYALPEAAMVELIIYNLLAQKVATIDEGFRQAGRYQVEFQAADLPTGVYFYRLTAGSLVETKKMLLLK